MKKLLIKIIVLTNILLMVVAINSYAITIGIDPGHGGSDTGAINYSAGLYERDLNLKIARYLKSYLEQYEDVTVLMTHNGELESNEKLEIVSRGMFARNNNVDLFVSLHNNAIDNTSVNGAEVYVTACTLLPKYNYESSILGNKILAKLSALGITNRYNGVATRLCNDTGAKWEYSDGSKADYYGIIRYAMKGDSSDTRGIDLSTGAGIPTILIEHAYVSGNTDTQFFDSEEDLRNLAVADGSAIVEYYGLELIDPTKVKSVTLDKTSIPMVIGDTATLTTTVLPTTATNKNVIYSSSDTNIATVNSSGLITGIATGTSTITATTQDGAKVATCIVNVSDVSLSIQSNPVNMLSESTNQIITTVGPEYLSDKSVSYISDNENIATVDSKGVITGVSEGTAHITVTTTKLNKSQNITVNVYDKSDYSIAISDNRKVENGKISKIGEKTTVQELIENVTISDNLLISIQNPSEIVLGLDNYVTTGSKIIFKDKENSLQIQEYNIIVSGDVNEDGKISAGDYVLIKNYIMETSQLDEIRKLGADVNKDERISAGDYVLIKNHIMDIKKIEL